MEDSVVKVTPSVYDYRGNAISTGILKLYRDYHRTSLIATVDISKGSSFLYAVPKCTADSSSWGIPIYYTFEGLDDENKINYTGISDVIFHSMKTNSLTIDAKDSEGNYASDGVLEINEGDSAFVSVDKLAYKVGLSNVKVYMVGKDDPLKIFSLNFASQEITFNKGDFPPGEYVIYAVYDGYVNARDGIYIAPATSNKIIIKINSQESQSNDRVALNCSVNDTNQTNSTLANSNSSVDDVVSPVIDKIDNNGSSKAHNASSKDNNNSTSKDKNNISIGNNDSSLELLALTDLFL